MPVRRRKTRDSKDSSKRMKGVFARKKVCRLCVKKVDTVDYKNVQLLKGFMADSGRILPKKTTGNCSKHQRITSKAIKKARNAGLLPFMNR